MKYSQGTKLYILKGFDIDEAEITAVNKGSYTMIVNSKDLITVSFTTILRNESSFLVSKRIAYTELHSRLSRRLDEVEEVLSELQKNFDENNPFIKRESKL